MRGQLVGCAGPAGCSALLLVICLATTASVAAQEYFIMTVAGGLQDGAPATSAALHNPRGVAVDGAGVLYIADSSNNRICKVRANGTIITVVGTGTGGFSGDGGPATSATLSAPWGMAVDSAGAVHIADSSNHCIRKVSTGGTITTVAGTGMNGFSGDGGPAPSAVLYGPYGVAVDSAGALYIADCGNNRIRMVSAGGTITTVAGTWSASYGGDGGPATSAALNYPRGVAVDSAGTLYIADTGNHRIRKVSTGGTITTVAGTGTVTFSGDNGPATSAALCNPHSVTVDSAGALYIADTSHYRIRKVWANGTITTVAGTGTIGDEGDGGPATSAALYNPSGVAVDSAGALHIADTYNYRIRKVSEGGTITTAAGTGSTTFGGDGSPAMSALLSNPSGVAVDAVGALFIADTSNYRVRKVSTGGTITTVAGTGASGFSGDGGPATSAALYDPYGVAVDGAGALYIVDSTNHRIRKVSAGGTISTVAGTGTNSFSGDGGPAMSAALSNPYGVFVDGVGALYIADSSNHRIRKVSAGSTITTVAGIGASGFGGDGGPSTSAVLSIPRGVAVDGAGVLYIADASNHRIRKVSTSGTITTVAGTGMSGYEGDGGPVTSAALYNPYDVAVDSAGALYVADSSNNRIRKVSAGGVITTVAGTGSASFRGDGGPATSAALNYPRGVAVDSAGTLYVADANNNRIRVVLPVLLVAPAQYFRSNTVTQAANVTLLGTRLSAATAVSIGGVVCGAVVTINDSAAVCRDWPVASAAALLTSSGQLPLVYTVLLTVLGVTTTVTGALPQGVALILPPVVSLLGSLTAKGGDAFSITGFNFQALISVANNTPSVFIGGIPCTTLVIVTFDALLRCTMPEVPPTTPGYPLLSVVVVNAVGQASNSTMTVEYPSLITATFSTSPPLADAIAGWPSSAAALALTAASPLTLLAGGKGVLTCTLFVTACATSTTPNPSDAATNPAIVGVTSLSATPPSTSSPAVLVFNATGLYAPSGATCNVSAQCRDAQGQSATAPTPVTLTTPRFSLAWSGTSTHIVAAPSGDLPSLPLQFSGDSSGPQPPQPMPTALLTCVALLVANTTTVAPSVTTPLVVASTYALTSTTAVAITRTTNTTANVTVTGLSAAACDLGAAYAIYAECTWAPTGERVRLLAPLQLRIPAVTFLLTPPATQLTAHEPSASWAASATLHTTSDAAVAFASAAGTCALQQVNTSSASLQLSAATLQASLPIAANGTIAVVPLVLEGPPAAALYARLACTVWGKAVVSAPLRLTTAPYLVAVVANVVAPVLASDALAATLFPVTPPLRAAAQGVESIACSLAVNASSVVCPPSSSPAYGIAYASPPLSTLQLVGEASASVAVPRGFTAAVVLFNSVGIRGGSGCVGNVTVTCRDSTGRTASSAAFTGAAPSSSLAAAAGSEPLAPHIALSVTALRASWDTAAPASLFTSLPPLPLPPINLTLLTTDPLSGASLAWPALAAASFSCVAAVLPQSSAAPLWSSPLSSASSAALSSCTGAPASDAPGSTTLNWTIDCLTAAAAPLGASYNLHAECTWLPTGERLRLPPVAVGIVDVRLAWLPPPTIVVQGYAAANVTLRLTVPAAISSGSTPAITAACTLALVNTTLRTASVVAEPWTLTIDPAAALTVAMPISITVQAPPRVTIFVRAECTAWGKMLASPPLQLTTASLAVLTAEPPPSTFLPSDPTASWPVSPPLVLRVATVETNTTAVDAACTLTTVTPSATLAAVDSGASLLAIAADPLTGVITVPHFIVQAAIGNGAAAVMLDVACKRSLSGDAVPLFQLRLQAVALRIDTCTAPATHSAMSVALPPFRFGVAARPPDSPAYDAPCAGGAALHTSLPPITCAVSLNVSASSTNDTANIFLQEAVARLDSTTHVASFDAFKIVAPQGETYGLTVACTIGSLSIPPAFAFSVALAGCPRGQQSEAVTCATCGGGQFSPGGVGARCRACPAVGAVCADGLLTLQPNYFRPPRQSGAAIGPDTELHPCFNAEACTLNASAAEYGCAPGYVGALCGVCDAAGNYARFGEACRVCWDPAASAFFVAVMVVIVFALLTRVALRKTTSRSDASIVLRITLSYLQAVGSLRVFVAGSTQAYASVMGWTDVVSASPLSVGALQCVARLPYLAQYVLTVMMPALAAGAVVTIFLAATALRAIKCKPRPACAYADARAALVAWWHSKRHWATLLFVLFIAYMPIVSASLRALDCVRPVGGVRYLRSDLAVECGVGEHAAARALAYVVLVVVGLGFPAGLAWLLGTATQTQLLDDAFHATWGFLFDGYRAPTLQLVGTPTLQLVGGGGSAAPSAGTTVPHAAHKAPSSSVPTHTRASRRSSLLPDRLAQSWRVEGDSRVWWEGVVLARKAGVVLLAVLVTNPYLQCVGATLWFDGFLLLQLRYAPYTKQLFNRLEVTSLAASALTAVISTALLQYNVGVASADQHAPAAMTPIEWAVTVTLAALNLGTFCALAGTWLALQCRRAQGIVRRVSTAAVAARRWSGRRSGTGGVGGGGTGLPAGGASDATHSTANPLRATECAPTPPTPRPMKAVLRVDAADCDAGTTAAALGIARRVIGHAPQPAPPADAAPQLRSLGLAAVAATRVRHGTGGSSGGGPGAGAAAL